MSLMQCIVDSCESENLVTDKFTIIQSDFCEHFSCELACLLMNSMSVWLIYGLELNINGWV